MTPTVQSGNKNTTATVVNGCIVARGHAYDATNPTQQNGGGIYIHGNNTGGGIFRIERCFFTENYGYYGGAIYVAAEVKNVNNGANLIDRCSFFNNAAGEREKSSNYGGAVCIAGQGYVFNSTIYNNENGGVLATKTGSAIINCTITRNTGAGVDGFTLPQEDTGKADQNIPVHNSVIWGNSKLTTNVTDNMPDFQYSAYPEAGTLGADPELITCCSARRTTRLQVRHLLCLQPVQAMTLKSKSVKKPIRSGTGNQWRKRPWSTRDTINSITT